MHHNERTSIFKMPETPQARLVGLSGSVQGRVYPLSLGTFVIGRGEACDLRLREAGVSREHAKIVAEGPIYVVQDNESRNGTLVNGQPVRRADLREGDLIALCSASFRFTYADVAVTTLPPEFGDNTDELAAASPHAVTSPGIALPGTSPARADAPERATRLLAVVAAIASVTAVVGVGVVVAVVMSRPPAVVVIDKGAQAGGTVAGTDAGMAAATRDAGLEFGAPAADIRSVQDAGDSEVEVVAAAAVPGDAGARATAADAGGEPDEVTGWRKSSRRKAAASSAAWVSVRNGPEVARAPVDGKVVSIVVQAEVGQPFLAIEGEPPFAAPASGPVTPLVRPGDVVRRGQVIARIAEQRARAELPAAVRKRARVGATLELRLAGGGTAVGVIDALVGSTAFVGAEARDIEALKLR